MFFLVRFSFFLLFLYFFFLFVFSLQVGMTDVRLLSVIKRVVQKVGLDADE